MCSKTSASRPHFHPYNWISRALLRTLFPLRAARPPPRHAIHPRYQLSTKASLPVTERFSLLGVAMISWTGWSNGSGDSTDDTRVSASRATRRGRIAERSFHPASIPRSQPSARVRRRSRTARDLHMLFADVRRQPPLPPSQAENASSILVARSFVVVRCRS
jgi:hypothetical protein